jgi:hypothetical protein
MPTVCVEQVISVLYVPVVMVMYFAVCVVQWI